MPSRVTRDTGDLYNALSKMAVGNCIDLPFPRFQRSAVGATANRAGIRILTRFLCLHPIESNDQIDTLRVWRRE
jgi:hypothetical protein